MSVYPTALPDHLLRRILKHRGVLESGQIANMRTYRIDSEIVHTRIVGESVTLCGCSLIGFEGRRNWQFIHRGSFGESLPSGATPGERDACQRCSRSPVITLTAEIMAERRRILTTRLRRRKAA